MKLRTIDLIVLFFLTGICALTYQSVIPRHSFSYDEADYMLAASKGLYTNYMDASAIPFFQFLEVGINRGLQKENTTPLSEFIRTSGDITIYRHYHGPLSLYALTLWRHFVDQSEYSLRWISLLFSIASVIAIYLSTFYLPNERTRLGAVLASILLLCSYPNIITATEISTHAVYVLVTIVALFFMAKLLQTRHLRYWYLAIVALALSCAATEYSAILFVTFAACVLVQRAEIFAGLPDGTDKKVLALSAALFIVTILIVWPGAWLKLTLVRNYVVMAYLTIARSGEFGEQNFWQVWRLRILSSPVEYALIAATTVTAIVKVKRCRWYLPFLVYAFLIFLITFRTATFYERYVSSLFPPLYILSGVVVAQHLQRSTGLVKLAAPTALILLLAFQDYSHITMLRENQTEFTTMDRVVDYFRTHSFEGKHILTDSDFLPILNYYFPRNTYRSYSGNVDDLGSLIHKSSGAGYDGIVYKGPEDWKLRANLREDFVVRTDLIAALPSENYKIIYYQLANGHAGN
jgi:hypothetical protein